MSNFSNELLPRSSFFVTLILFSEILPVIFRHIVNSFSNFHFLCCKIIIF